MKNFPKFLLGALFTSAFAMHAQAETITVTNTNSYGTGSLHQAIIDANADDNHTSIRFSFYGDKILLNDALPEITTPVDIDGAVSYQGISELLKVSLVDNTIQTPIYAGLRFSEGSEGSVVSNTKFEDFIHGVIVNTTDIEVRANEFIGNRAMHIFADANDAIIFGNIFNSTEQGSSLAIQGIATNNLKFNGNVLYGCGIYIQNSNNVQIGNLTEPTGYNQIRNASSAGIRLEQTAAEIMQTTIIGSVAEGIIADQGSVVTSEGGYFANNKGYDVKINGGSGHSVSSFQIVGADIFSGIFVANGYSVTLTGFDIQKASIELNSVTHGTITDGVINEDEQGVSGHGAVTLWNSSMVTVDEVTLSNNASNGVYLYQSYQTYLKDNSIINNGRAGIRQIGGVRNSFVNNVIDGNKAAAMGGQSGISISNVNLPVVAPEITSVSIEGDDVIVTGTRSSYSHAITLYLSDEESTTYSLISNATELLGHASSDLQGQSSEWEIVLNKSDFAGTFYVIATAIAQDGSTSEFSNGKEATQSVIVDGITGPTTVTQGGTFTYTVPTIDGVSYSWYVSGDGAITGQGTSTITVTYGNWFTSGAVNCGFQHPTEGWTTYTLAVSTNSNARTGEFSMTTDQEAIAYPNPFVNQLFIGLEGQSYEVSLYAQDGSILIQDTVEGGTALQVEDVEQGVYTLKVVNNGEETITRIIK